MATTTAEQTRELGEKTAAGIDTLAGRAKGMAQDAADTVADATETARGIAGEAYERGGRAAQHLAGRVEERPLAALLIAGALGYAMAYLLHGRR